MKIAIVTSTYLPTRNGVTIHIQSLVKGLEAEGHDVYVISPKNGKERFCKCDLRIASIYNPFSKLYPIPFSSQIPNEIRDVKFDVVHLHHPIGVYGLAKRISKKSDCPLVFTNHTQYLAYINYYTYLFRWFVKQFMLSRLKKLYGEASVILGSTLEIKNEIHKINPTANVEIVPVGFDESRFEIADNPEIRKQIGLASPDFFALYVGRVSKEKNIDNLLKAADKVKDILPNLMLVIVGPGDYLENTKKTIPSNVIITGQPKDSDLVALYKHCDLFLSASTSEVLPLTFSEAAYCGAPLLGMDSLGVRDIIKNGENGFLAKNQKDFEDKLIEMVGSPELLDKFRRNAPGSVMKYSAKHNLRKIIRIYKKSAK